MASALFPESFKTSEKPWISFPKNSSRFCDVVFRENSLLTSPCLIEEKIRLLKFVYSDLDLKTIKEAADKLGITPNGVRKIKKLIDLGGKKYVKLWVHRIKTRF